MAKPDDIKKEKNNATSFGQDILSGAVGQSINEFTIEIVKKIPIEVLETMKTVGIDKILPIIGVIAGSILPRTGPWGDRLSDFVNELTAEIRRRIKEEAGKTSTFYGATTGAGMGKIFNTILDPHISKKNIGKLLKNLSSLFKQGDDMRPKEEQDQIIALLNQMGPRQLLVLLDMEATETRNYVDSFVKKVKTINFEEAVNSLKAELSKAYGALRKELKPVDDFVGRHADIASTCLRESIRERREKIAKYNTKKYFWRFW